MTDIETIDPVQIPVRLQGRRAPGGGVPGLFARELFTSDQYQEYLYWHSMNEVLKQGYRGARYSFGYPACPNRADQDKILALLDAARIGVVLGDEDQLWPEESTSAIVTHHPQIKYFTM